MSFCSSSTKKKFFFVCLIVFLLTVVLDQAAKRFLIEDIGLNNNKELIPGFINLTVVQNTGGAFSILNRHPEYFKIIGTINVIIFSFLTFCPTIALNKWVKTGCALILGGSLGNLIDRITYGSVVDFIEPMFINFAIFNLADVFINAGVALVLIGWFTSTSKDHG